MQQEFYVDAENSEIRIDKYLANACPQLSRSYIQKLLKSGKVSIRGEGVKPSYVVAEEDQIILEVPEPVELEICPEPMDLDIVYEDQDVILVNKAKGIVVHPASGHYSHTLVNGLMHHCQGELSGINGVMRPGIVHRIDMDTTGLLIVCKNDMAHNSIAAQLKEHSLTRRYQAIVHGRLTEEGTIDAPIGRHPVERKKMSIQKQGGRSAVTHYKILTSFQQYTHIECQLETGRTHQIRVHMASIHHPLLGDLVYGPSKCPYSWLQGQTLHAGVLGFIHPRTGNYMEFTAPLPEYFQKLLHILH